MANFDFSHLKVEASKTATYTLYQLEGEPHLELAPAGEVNKPYFNDALRRLKKRQAQIKATGIDASLVRANRVEEYDLFAKHIVKNWHGVVDSTGADVPFSEDNAREFLAALPTDLFDAIRDFAADLSNFREGEAPATGDIAGN